MARRIWVTADTHFGHAEAIELFGRPFRDVREMDGALLDAIKPNGQLCVAVQHFANLRQSGVAWNIAAPH